MKGRRLKDKPPYHGSMPEIGRVIPNAPGFPIVILFGERWSSVMDGGKRIASDGKRPVRQRLYHVLPPWVDDGATFFITVCCAEHGPNQLCRPEVFHVLTEALEQYVRRERWWVEVFLAMPDHWHALMSFPKHEQMAGVMKDWKRYVAKRAGVKWQDGFLIIG